jgi:hypothetical protein
MPPTNLLKSNSIVVIPNNIHFDMVLTATVKQIIDDMDNKHITLNLQCQKTLKDFVNPSSQESIHVLTWPLTHKMVETRIAEPDEAAAASQWPVNKLLHQ